MSRSVARSTTTKLTHAKQSKPEELYEEVEMVDNKHCYATSMNPQAQVAVNSPPPSIGKPSIKLSKGSLIALIVAFLVCAVIVSLVAVVMYSPLVQGSTGAAQESALLARIQQLEERMQAVQQLQVTNTSFESLQEAMALVQTKLQQQADYDVTVSSQFAVVHNSMQSLSLQQTTLRQDIDGLRSVNIYQSCFEETRTCQISTTSSSTYTGCSTSGIDINPRDSSYFTSSVWCDLSSTSYFNSISYYKSGNNIYCYCEVTRPTDSSHSTFSYNGICTLTVTKCPLTLNLLSEN